MIGTLVRKCGVKFALGAAASSVALLSGVSAAGAQEADEIVVTAQKREENLQDVPISVTVLGGEELDRSSAQGVTEALSTVPGVATAETFQGGGTQVVVRGVAAAGPTLFGSSPVAYYMDSVPFGLVKTAIAPDASPFDLERVEVLRGPQGTLYGASALAGVVRILTHEADLDAFEFKARTSTSGTADGDESYRGDVAINVPLIEDRLAARAVFGYQDLGGWIDKPFQRDANDAEIRTARFRINAAPTNNLSIGLSAWLSSTDLGAPSTSRDAETSASLVEEPQSTDYSIYGMTIGYDFDWFTLTSQTSYIDYANKGFLDYAVFFGPAAGIRLYTNFGSEVSSEELLLSSSGDGPWQWSLGGFYRDAEDHLLQTRANRPAPIDFTDSSESWAVFGEVTRSFLDGRLELTGGLRFFHDDVTAAENVKQNASTTQPLLIRTSEFEATSPRVVLNYHPNDDLTLYASYAEGFRSGFDQNAIALTVAPQLPPVEADTLTNYEVGAKGSILDGRVSFDAALYYTDWQDVQQQLLITAFGASVAAVINGESASGVGFDLALATRPTDNLELGATFSWNNLAVDSDVLSGGILLFNEGDRLNYSPEYTIGAYAEYDWELGGGFGARWALSGNYTSERDGRTLSAGAVARATGDEMLVARTSLSLDAPSGWTATLFADNITDERGVAIAPAAATPDWATRIRPLTIGAQLEYRF